jgi:hypothetical protein
VPLVPVVLDAEVPEVLVVAEPMELAVTLVPVELVVAALEVAALEDAPVDEVARDAVEETDEVLEAPLVAMLLVPPAVELPWVELAPEREAEDVPIDPPVVVTDADAVAEGPVTLRVVVDEPPVEPVAPVWVLSPVGVQEMGATRASQHILRKIMVAE